MNFYFELRVLIKRILTQNEQANKKTKSHARPFVA